MIPKFLLILFIILTLTSSTASAELEGEDFFFRNHFPKAIDILSQSRDRESQYLLGLSHLRMGLFYREIYPHLVSLCTHYYELLYGLGEFVESTQQSKYIDSKYTLYYLGLVYYQQGRYESAKEAFMDFLVQKDIPLNFQAYSQIALGKCYYRMGKKKECERSLAKAQTIADSLSKTKSDAGIAIALELAVARSRLYGNIDRTNIDLNSINDRSIHELNAGERIRYHINVGWLLYRKGNLGSTYQEIKDLNLAQPIMADRLDKIKVIEFCDPIIFDQMADIYFANAHAIFEKLLESNDSDIAHELRYADAISLYQLGNYDLAISRLQDLFEITDRNSIVKGFARILLSACYYKQGDHEKAETLWQNISKGVVEVPDFRRSQQKSGTSATHRLPVESSRIDSKSLYSSLLSVELASVYNDLGIHIDQAVGLCEKALPILLEKSDSSKNRMEQIEDLLPPPLDAFSQSELFIRVGRVFLKAGKIDEAISTYKIAQDPVHINVVDAQGWGNDPVLLIDLAFAYYKRGYNTYNSATETYSVMQKFYPEIYHLHTTMQGIFVIEHNIHEKEEEMRKGK